MYADPSVIDPTQFNIVTGTYWECGSTCDESTVLQRDTSDIPYPEVNGWIPVVDFKADSLPQWKIYDENGNLHASGPSTPGYTVIAAAFVPKSGAWFAYVSYDGKGEGTFEVRALPGWTPLVPPTAVGNTSVGALISLVGAPEPDQLLVVNQYGGDLRLLDTTTWKLTTASLPFHEIGSAVFSADGQTLVTASTSGDIAIRDPATFASAKDVERVGRARQHHLRIESCPLRRLPLAARRARRQSPTVGPGQRRADR